MDQERVVTEIVKRHGVLVDRNDPILMISTMLALHESDHADAVAEMRRIVEEGRIQAAALLAEIKKDATRPIVTPHQLQYEVMPKLVANLDAKVLFKMLAALVVTAVVFGGSGLATGWWWFEVLLTCGATMIAQTGPVLSEFTPASRARGLWFSTRP